MTRTAICVAIGLGSLLGVGVAHPRGGSVFRVDDAEAIAVNTRSAREVPSSGGHVQAQRNRSTSIWIPPKTQDGQPDLQGVWINNSITPLERPTVVQGRTHLSDEEVVQLRDRVARLVDNGRGDVLLPDQLFVAALSNFSEPYKNPNATGTFSQGIPVMVDNRSSLITDPSDGKIPPLTAAAQARQAAVARAGFGIPWFPGIDPAEQKQRAAAAEARRQRPSGPEDLSNGLRCITWGVPKLGGNAMYTSHLQILQTPKYVVLLSEVNHELRMIPLDGRPHLPTSIRQWNGDARGRWEGNTLVVDTTNFASTSYFMGSSDNLHLIERLTRIAPDTISYQITMEDATTWVTPWTAEIRLKHSQDRLYESACHEGNHHLVSGILEGARAEERADPVGDPGR